MVLPGGNGTILDSAITAGVCVQSQDKLFGNFNLAGLPQPGSITFGFMTVSGVDQHTITFSDPFMPNNTYTNSFEVQVLNTNDFISQLRADITQTQGGPTTLMQNTTPAGSAMIDLSKSGNVVTGNFIDNFTAADNVTDLVVASTLTTGPNSDTSAILNTIIQAVPIPKLGTLSSLGLLVVAFVGMRLVRGRNNLSSAKQRFR
jgi:hypothetical protein